MKLLNLDEATLIVKGPGGTKHDKVGMTLKLTKKGVYKITMVKQAPDDNHLKLTIKYHAKAACRCERARLSGPLSWPQT